MLAFASVNRVCGSDFGVYTIRLDGRRARLVSQCRESPEQFDWSPKGRRIAYIAMPYCWLCDRWPPPWWVATVRPDGTQRQRYDYGDSEYVYDLAWGPDGVQLAWIASDGIYLGTFREPRGRFLAYGIDPDWSPDGRYLAVVEPVPVDGRGVYECGRLSIIEVASGKRVLVLAGVRITGNDCVGGGRSPSWSPDGERIAYEAPARGESQLEPRDREVFVVNVDGTRRERLTRNRLVDSEPAWSPDGKLIAYGRARWPRNPELYVMRPDGGRKRYITDEADHGAAWQVRH